MKVIKNKNTCRIATGTDLEVNDHLEAKVFEIFYDKKIGHWLEELPDYVINEKIYGSTEKDTAHVLKAYSQMNRGCGVLLSGNKGLGKTMMAKNLCIEASKIGMPIISVSKNVPGLVDFINSIEQEVVVMFDEFEKIFSKNDRINEMDDENSKDRGAQDMFLSLFDGFATYKRLYICTCNELKDLSTFMLNRPGRFHYNYKFMSPTDETIKEYVQDHISNKNQELIDQVIQLSRKVDLTYDILRAICFEIEVMGISSLQEAIKNLNIFNESTWKRYDIALYMSNGDKLEDYINLDLFAPETRIGMYSTDSCANQYQCIIKFSGTGIIPLSRGSYSVKIDDPTTITTMRSSGNEKYPADLKPIKLIISEQLNLQQLLF